MKSIFKHSLLVITLIGLATCHANSKSNNLNVENTKDIYPNQRFIKVALLLDTSNSMDGLIDQAKAQLWEIVNELSYAKCQNERPNLQIALYEYGNDGLDSRSGYIRSVLNFSEDLDEISKALFSLTTNGGNEYCGQVIQSALDQLHWGKNPDDLKLIFIAGNEPFTQGSVNYKDASMNANEKDVTVNTIYCGNYQEGIGSYWKEGADLSGGDYMAIDHNQTTVHIVSPFDEAILILNSRLNGTYVHFGSQGKHKMALQEEQDTEAQSYSDANAVSRTVSKSSHLYKNSSWDLVDAIKENEIAIKDLKNEVLPEELKGKNTSEIQAYINEKSKEREIIQKEIQALNAKRKTFIEKQLNDSSNQLENALLTAIKSQAKKKDYKWN